MKDKEPKQVEITITEEPKVISNKYVSVSYGPNGEGDYIFNIEQLTMARPFPANLKHIYGFIIRHLDKILKIADRREVLPPPSDWDFKLITVKAVKLDKWNFEEDTLVKPIEDLIEEIAKYLDLLHPKKALR